MWGYSLGGCDLASRGEDDDPWSWGVGLPSYISGSSTFVAISTPSSLSSSSAASTNIHDKNITTRNPSAIKITANQLSLCVPGFLQLYSPSSLILHLLGSLHFNVVPWMPHIQSSLLSRPAALQNIVHWFLWQVLFPVQDCGSQSVACSSWGPYKSNVSERGNDILYIF